MKKQRILIVVLVIGLLVAAVGVASAQGRGNRGGDRFGDNARMAGGVALIQQVADATGLTTQDVYTKLSEGMTFSDILTEANVDVEQFKADVLANVQANAAARLESLTTQLDTALTQVYEDLPQWSFGDGDMFKHMAGLALGSQVVDATGLTAQEVYSKLSEGMTFSDILTEASVDIEQFKADVIAAAQERATAAVESGRITQERADALIATVTENLDTALTQVFDLSAQMPFGGRMGRQGRGGDMFDFGFGFGPLIPNPDTTPTAPTGGSL